jgi:hypothetical protein
MIALQGYDLAQAPDSIELTLHWETAGAPPDAALFVHLLDATGQRRAQVDLPTITAGWEAGRRYRTRVKLSLPSDLPVGMYKLVSGLYDPQSFARLPLSGGPSADPASAGPDALLVADLQH